MCTYRALVTGITHTVVVSPFGSTRPSLASYYIQSRRTGVRHIIIITTRRWARFFWSWCGRLTVNVTKYVYIILHHPLVYIVIIIIIIIIVQARNAPLSKTEYRWQVVKFSRENRKNCQLPLWRRKATSVHWCLRSSAQYLIKYNNII